MDEEAEQDALQDEQWSARPRQCRICIALSQRGHKGSQRRLRIRSRLIARCSRLRKTRRRVASSPVPISVLPDVDEGHDLDAQQGSELSYLATSQVPGFTERPSRIGARVMAHTSAGAG